MSPSEVECCFKQILNGVQYLHSQGVAHRDIKPENLFFDTKGALKVGIFAVVYLLSLARAKYKSRSVIMVLRLYIDFLGKQRSTCRPVSAEASRISHRSNFWVNVSISHTLSLETSQLTDVLLRVCCISYPAVQSVVAFNILSRRPCFGISIHH
jgi:serine/threonine protein kinase